MKPSKLAAAVVAGALSLVGGASESVAGARDECVDAHGRGQDLRERGHLIKAKQAFLMCAQSSCPSLVSSDCARFGEELSHLVPTVSFVARDASAVDLPDTTVYVDDVLMATRLDDGKTYELDPGKHVVRYVHEGRETTNNVILNQGEKGRVLIATFVDPRAQRRAEWEVPEPPKAPTRSALPLVVAGLGAAGAVAGGVLYGIGLASVPSSCSVSARECAAPPGDPSFDQAKSGVSLANTGATIGIAGGLILVGGLVWYFVQPKGEASRREATLSRVLTF